MTRLVWDAEDERDYEYGLDRGVLYSLDGSAVVWNGLVSVKEEVGAKAESSYFGGVKVQDRVNPGNYKATVEAITYPDILDDYARPYMGAVIDAQIPNPHTFSYREQVSDGSYNIHVIGNATFISQGRGYSSINSSASLSRFVWDVMAPRTAAAALPTTAHLEINTGLANPLFVNWLEEQLYGTSSTDPSIPSFQDFLAEVVEWTIISIVDHGDGTWSATADLPGYVSSLGGNKFQVNDADVTWITPDDEYEIGDI